MNENPTSSLVSSESIPGSLEVRSSSPQRGVIIKQRLDAELLRRKMVASRQAAQRQIRAGAVLVDGAVADKPSRMVQPSQELALVDGVVNYVSRAGEKLEAALNEFAIDPQGLRCLDAGSSTGGFTDCLLQRGASSVLAVDVGTNQLHPRIRADRRVIVHEQTDIRSISPTLVDPRADLIVVDLSFISLRLALPALRSVLAYDGAVIGLVKPQFEAGRAAVSKGRGVIRDPELWRRALGEVVVTAADLALRLRGATVSPITGASGNVEFIVWLEAVGPDSGASRAVDDMMLDTAVANAEAGAA